MEIIQTFLLPGAWIALLTLIFLEVVLGIDNIVFLSIMTSKLPKEKQAHGRTVGLLLAMVARIVLLFGISLLMLVIEAAHLSHLNIFGYEVGEIPKGYIYFAIGFSLLVEFLNSKLRKRSK
jgi:predicted tellurium resistance membrane protein TerC